MWTTSGRSLTSCHLWTTILGVTSWLNWHWRRASTAHLFLCEILGGFPAFPFGWISGWGSFVRWCRRCFALFAAGSWLILTIPAGSLASLAVDRFNDCRQWLLLRQRVLGCSARGGHAYKGKRDKNKPGRTGGPVSHYAGQHRSRLSSIRLGELSQPSAGGAASKLTILSWRVVRNTIKGVVARSRHNIKHHVGRPRKAPR